jgi:hypothetical protein
MKLLDENTDEIIAIAIVIGYLAAWFVNNPMPTEPLMIILGYYFGKKVTQNAASV